MMYCIVYIENGEIAGWSISDSLDGLRARIGEHLWGMVPANPQIGKHAVGRQHWLLVDAIL